MDLIAKSILWTGFLIVIRFSTFTSIWQGISTGLLVLMIHLIILKNR